MNQNTHVVFEMHIWILETHILIFDILNNVGFELKKQNANMHFEMQICLFKTQICISKPTFAFQNPHYILTPSDVRHTGFRLSVDPSKINSL